MAQDNQKIRDAILSFGFDAAGIAPYGVLDDDRRRLETWLAEGCHGPKEYMAAWARWDPRIVFGECRSVAVVLAGPQCERYHGPLRKRLKHLLRELQLLDPSIEGRGVVDSAPIFEKAWAVRAGLGWIGRNTLLINPKLGSNFNIGILLLNVELPYDVPYEGDGCVGCAACLGACPSGALGEKRTLDCRVCISALNQQTAGAPYGCLVCQEACPYNK